MGDSCDVQLLGQSLPIDDSRTTVEALSMDSFASLPRRSGQQTSGM